ncbi:hypothetical protein, partial [Robiginitalea biformata]|uniref:hypothetical protein n=1 Tax=Robiginitalea biformata TaxID=252307 RepID=UPI003D32ED2C
GRERGPQPNRHDRNHKETKADIKLPEYILEPRYGSDIPALEKVYLAMVHRDKRLDLLVPGGSRGL